MSARIQVVDRLQRPVEGRTVLVLWDGGSHSERRTNQTGIADLETTGLARSISINGREVLSNTRLENQVYQVTDPYG